MAQASPAGIGYAGVAPCVRVLVGENSLVPLLGKPRIDQDRRQKIDINGKLAYAPALKWRNRDLSDRFSAAVVELVRAAHPNAVDGGAS